MKRNESLFFATTIAFIATIIEIMHKKFGGLLSGGRYSSSHTWEELINMIPYFFSFFLAIFVGAFVYYFYIHSK